MRLDAAVKVQEERRTSCMRKVSFREVSIPETIEEKVEI